ncbi:MAG: hypothetical protein RBT47_09595, partial [Anaerolineae bacterium]|nr:hypothetical protein [Anaerolineae bacterium]
AIIKAVCERGGQYVVDAQQRLVGVLISWEEYEHYLDLLDDEERQSRWRIDREANSGCFSVRSWRTSFAA